MIKEAIWEIDQFFRERDIPNKMLLTIHDELVWKHKGKQYGEDIARIMGEVGTKYLEGFTVMKAHADVKHSWTK